MFIEISEPRISISKLSIHAKSVKKFLNSKGITDFDRMPPFNVYDEMIDTLSAPLIQSGMKDIEAHNIIIDAWDELSN